MPFLGTTEMGPVELLSGAQRQQLERHANVRTLKARTVVYRAGSPARAVFFIGDGVVKSFRDLPSGRRRIAAFFFAHDLFGLAERGHYVNSVQAVTAATVYEISLDALTVLFQHDPDLKLQFLCKAAHVIREVQHHNIVIARRDAPGKLAMLIRLLQQQSSQERSEKSVPLPMTKSDMASYLGLTLETVVRAGRWLERQHIVEFRGRHQAYIIDTGRFEALVSDT